MIIIQFIYLDEQKPEIKRRTHLSFRFVWITIRLLDHAVIAAAVRQWRRRLSACVKAGAGHFEHCF